MGKTQLEREKEKGLKRFTLILPQKDLTELKIYAAEQNVSMMDILREAIVKFLSKKKAN